MTENENEVYKKYKDNYPFSLVNFANDIGIKVYLSDNLDYETSGLISKKDNQFSIIINNSHSSLRKRFTLAHELGHYFNDKDYLENKGEISDSTKQSTRKFLFRQSKPVIDREMVVMDNKANKFAAELLMPEDIFIEKWQEYNNPQQVANFFAVSVQAVNIRASKLLGEIVQ